MTHLNSRRDNILCFIEFTFNRILKAIGLVLIGFVIFNAIKPQIDFKPLLDFNLLFLAIFLIKVPIYKMLRNLYILLFSIAGLSFCIMLFYSYNLLWNLVCQSFLFMVFSTFLGLITGAKFSTNVKK